MEENAENNTVAAACRLCDQISETVFNVFDKTEDGTQILHLIKENLPIIIYRTDPLSKVICQKCLNTLDSVDKFRKISQATQEKYKKHFRNSTECNSDAVRLYLGFDSNFSENGEDIDEELKDACTSTDDLTILCSNCKQTILDGSFVNGEVELCTDLHNAIAESLRKNRVVTETDSEKVLRKRKVQPLYQEFDDSLCSSLTEFTRHTELDDENFSQCGYETHSDVDSEESDNERPKKRPKLDETQENNDEEVQAPLVAADAENTENTGNTEKQEDYSHLVEKFKQEPEVSYEPLSLLRIALNAINRQNVPDYTPEHFQTIPTKCVCEHCGKSFQNLKLLALHEPTHIFVEVEEKVDQPVPWNESKGDDFKIRNKWLSYFDENGYAEDDIVVDVMETSGNSVNTSSLLIPHDSKNTNTETKEGNDIVLIDMKPTVNGIYLGDYTKEERKNFYQCMKVGGQTKRFCQLCRYCFKDNWAIESHYFSLACHYTCRYCGMRFNKQRPRYEEHIKEHVDQNHEFSDKIFAASKVNNFLPKILKPDKIRETEPEPLYPHNMPVLQPQISITSGLRVRNNIGANRPSPPYLVNETVIKEEPREIITSQSKTGNQAYFCRKCYKVFFKLDEFNLHSKNCNYNQFPGALRHIQLAMTAMPRNPMPSGAVGNQRRRSPSDDPLATPSRGAPANRSLTNGSNGDVSNTGRPIRNCAKDVGPYKDEVYIPKELLRETVPNNHAQPQSFVCHICGTPFPTIYSRNSHMRIHKGDPTGMGGVKVRPPAHHQQYLQYPKFAEVKIKQEPIDSFEPMVEIHEGEQKYSQHRPSKPAAPPPPSSLGDGAVSITPIAKKPPATNPSKAAPTSASSNVMRLVHNNPHLTIKKPDEKYRVPSSGGGPHGGFHGNSHAQSNSAANYVNAMLMDADKSYKCSSCWEAFSNKSHLYFHKKNQCEGSRFPCPFCKKRFGTEAAYSSHIFYSHPE